MTRMILHRLRRVLLWVVCVPIAGALPAPGTAQTVRAVVMTEQHQGIRPRVIPLRGRVTTPDAPGYIVLLDGDSREAGRAINNTTGLVVVQAPRPGRYRLRSERVGFQSVVSAPFELRSGQIVDITIDVANEPVQLADIALTPSTACGTRPAQDPRTSTLWSEIRKALAAASWTGGRIDYEYLGRRFVREVSTGGRVTSEQAVPAIGPSVLGNEEVTPSDAYVPTHDESVASFLSNGPDFLLDETFQDDYCFSIVRNTETGQLGLRFRPNESQDITDVRGDFWVDPASAELRSLDYRVVNLPYDSQDRTGGTVHFMRTPSGRWVVTHWKTRVPVVRRGNGREELLRFRDLGGGLSMITTSMGRSVYRAPLAELRGTIVDAQSAPVAGATVSLVGTSYATESNPDGEFAMAGALEGEYAVAYSHPMLDSLAFSPPEHYVSLAPGRTDTVALTMPALEAIVNPLCEDKLHGPGQRIIVGVVRDSETLTVAEGVRVTARIGDSEMSAVTNAEGFYTICGVSPYVPVELHAEFPDKTADAVTLTFDDAGVDRAIGGGGQSEYRQTTRTTWVEDFQLAQILALPRSNQALIGFKFGGTASTVSGDGVEAEGVTGFQLGMFYEGELNELFSWRVEGLYVQQGAYSTVDGAEMPLSYLKLPLLLKLRLSGDSSSATLAPYLLGGPAVSFDTRGKRGVPKGDISFVLGGGVRVRAGGLNIMLDGTYGFGITSNSPPALHEVGEFEQRVARYFDGNHFKNHLLSFSVGVAFPMGGSIATGGAPSRDRGRPPRGDIITRDEIIATDLATAYQVVQRLHPQWLRSRGQVTMRENIEQELDTSGPQAPVVYVNSARRGDLDELRNITVETIAEILYYNGRDASFRFGAGHGSGVIQVITGL